MIQQLSQFDDVVVCDCVWLFVFLRSDHVNSIEHDYCWERLFKLTFVTDSDHSLLICSSIIAKRIYFFKNMQYKQERK